LLEKITLIRKGRSTPARILELRKRMRSVKAGLTTHHSVLKAAGQPHVLIADWWLRTLVHPPCGLSYELLRLKPYGNLFRIQCFPPNLFKKVARPVNLVKCRGRGTALEFHWIIRK